MCSSFPIYPSGGDRGQEGQPTIYDQLIFSCLPSQIHTANDFSFLQAEALVHYIFCESSQTLLCIYFSRFTITGIGKDILAVVDFIGKQMKERVSEIASGR